MNFNQTLDEGLIEGQTLSHALHVCYILEIVKWLRKSGDR